MTLAKILIVAPMKKGDPTTYTHQWAQKALSLAKDFGYNTKSIEKDSVTYDNVTNTIKIFKPNLFSSLSHGCPMLRKQKAGMLLLLISDLAATVTEAYTTLILISDLVT